RRRVAASKSWRTSSAGGAEAPGCLPFGIFPALPGLVLSPPERGRLVLPRSRDRGERSAERRGVLARHPLADRCHRPAGNAGGAFRAPCDRDPRLSALHCGFFRSRAALSRALAP